MQCRCVVVEVDVCGQSGQSGHNNKQNNGNEGTGRMETYTTIESAGDGALLDKPTVLLVLPCI